MKTKALIILSLFLCSFISCNNAPQKAPKVEEKENISKEVSLIKQEPLVKGAIYLNHKAATQLTLVGKDNRPIPKIEYIKANDKGVFVKIENEKAREFMVANSKKEDGFVVVVLGNGYVLTVSENDVFFSRGIDTENNAMIYYPRDLAKMLKAYEDKKEFSDDKF